MTGLEAETGVWEDQFSFRVLRLVGCSVIGQKTMLKGGKKVGGFSNRTLRSFVL